MFRKRFPAAPPHLDSLRVPCQLSIKEASVCSSPADDQFSASGAFDKADELEQRERDYGKTLAILQPLSLTRATSPDALMRVAPPKHPVGTICALGTRDVRPHSGVVMTLLFLSWFRNSSEKESSAIFRTS